MKKKKQKKTDAAGKYTRPAAGPGGSGPGISSGPYGGAQQLPALQTIPFQPLQIQQEPMQPLPLAPGCERGASRGTKERTPADPAGICGATFERSENGVASTLPPAGATTGQPGFAAGEMRPNGSKGRVFAVGAPARRSRDGNGKIAVRGGEAMAAKRTTAQGGFAQRNAAPDFARQTQKVGPMTGQPGFAAGKMRPNGSKGRGGNGSRVWEKRKASAFAGPITKSADGVTFLMLRK